MLSEHYKLPTTLPEDAELADLLGGPPKAMDQFVMQCMYRDVHDDSETTFVGNLDVLTHDSKKALEQLDLRLYNKWKQEIKAAGLAKSGTDFVEARQAFWCAFCEWC